MRRVKNYLYTVKCTRITAYMIITPDTCGGVRACVRASVSGVFEILTIGIRAIPNVQVRTDNRPTRAYL